VVFEAGQSSVLVVKRRTLQAIEKCGMGILPMKSAVHHGLEGRATTIFSSLLKRIERVDAAFCLRRLIGGHPAGIFGGEDSVDLTQLVERA
jgi:hypothetical protein